MISSISAFASPTRLSAGDPLGNDRQQQVADGFITSSDPKYAEAKLKEWRHNCKQFGLLGTGMVACSATLALLSLTPGAPPLFPVVATLGAAIGIPVAYVGFKRVHLADAALAQLAADQAQKAAQQAAEARAQSAAQLQKMAASPTPGESLTVQDDNEKVVIKDLSLPKHRPGPS